VTQNMPNLIFLTIICIKSNFLSKCSIYPKSCDFSIFTKNFKNELILKLFVAFSMFSMVRNRFRRVSENIFQVLLWFTGKIWLLNFKKKLICLRKWSFSPKARTSPNLWPIFLKTRWIELSNGVWYMVLRGPAQILC
jgi:hypothetical protein